MDSANNEHGTSTVEITADDGSTTDVESFVLTVHSVNDAPSGTNATIITSENNDYIFQTSDFVLTDSNDSPANTLDGVQITSLPSQGTLKLSGIALSVNDTIVVADISAGNFSYDPPAGGIGAAYTSFSFKVQDDGATANGGIDLDPSANTMTIDILDFAINNDATYTNTTSVSLTNILCPSGTEIAYGNSANPTNWEACTTTKAHSLSAGDGQKTVFMRWREGAEVTADLTRTIIFDTTVPSGVVTQDPLAATWTSGSVDLTMSATDATAGMKWITLPDGKKIYTPTAATMINPNVWTI